MSIENDSDMNFEAGDNEDESYRWVH